MRFSISPLPRLGWMISIVLLALLCRAFVPAGFMPAASGGQQAIVICSGFGEKTIYVDDSGKPVSTDHAVDGQSCSFALGGTPVLPAPAFAAAFCAETGFAPVLPCPHQVLIPAPVFEQTRAQAPPVSLS